MKNPIAFQRGFEKKKIWKQVNKKLFSPSSSKWGYTKDSYSGQTAVYPLREEILLDLLRWPPSRKTDAGWLRGAQGRNASHLSAWHSIQSQGILKQDLSS